MKTPVWPHLLCALLLAGCAAPTPSPAPATQTAISASTASPTSASACRLEDVLTGVDTVLAGFEFEAHILTINRRLTLSIWMVDAQLDLAAEGTMVDSQARRAFLTGARMSQGVAEQVPCVRRLLEAINPMIVDRAYNNWYIDIIPMRALPQGHPADDDLLAAIEQSGMDIAFLRRMPPQPHPTPAGQSCAWPQVKDQIHGLFGSARRNVATYPIIGYQPASRGPGDESGMYVAVQWDVASPAEADQQSVLAVLGQIKPIVSCLTPPLDRLEIYVVDPDGKLLVYALVPGDIVRADRPLDPDRFTMIFFQPN